MPGHMGQVRRTTQNLEVIEVRLDHHLILVRGAVPGAKGDWVIVRESKKLPKGSSRAKARLLARHGDPTASAKTEAKKK